MVEGKKKWRYWVELVGNCLFFRLWLLLVLESALSIISSTGTATVPLIIWKNKESIISLRLSFYVSQPRSCNIRETLDVRPYWVELVGNCLYFRSWLLLVLESALSIVSSTGTAIVPLIIWKNKESLISLRLSFYVSQPRSCNIRETLHVQPKSWVVKPAALLWIASRLLICFFRCGSQIQHSQKVWKLKLMC